MTRQADTQVTERRGPDLVSRVFEHLAGQGGSPRLGDLMRSLVTTLSDQPLTRGVAVCAVSSETGLLDPAWTRRVKPCLWNNPRTDTPEWIVPPTGWLEGSLDDPLRGGSGPYPDGGPWPESESADAAWVRLTLRVHDRTVLTLHLVLAGEEKAIGWFTGELVRLQGALEPLLEIWAEAVGLRANLNQARTENQALTRLSRLQGRLVAMASHEFKTPLTSITAYTDTLSAQVTDAHFPHATEFLGVIRSEAERLLRLVNRILDFSSLDHGHRLLGARPLDMADLINDTVRAMAPRIAEKGLICRVDLPEDRPLAEVEPDLLRQVLMNLIGNAVKYTPAGGRIDVSVRETAASVEVSIADNGPGIPTKDIRRIFREFYRSDRTAEKEEGSGLGLAIVRHILNLHEGHIDVRRRTSGGSVFSFLVPKEMTQPGRLPARFTRQVDEAEGVRLGSSLLRLMAEMTAHLGAALLLRDGEGRLVPVVSMGLGGLSLPVIGLPESPGIQALMATGGVLCDGPATEPALACLGALPGPGNGGALVALGQGEACLGLAALGRRANREPYTPADRDQMQVLAAVAGNALGALLADRSADPQRSATARVNKVQEAVRLLLQIRRSGIPTASAPSLALLSGLAGRLDMSPRDVDSLLYAATLHDAGMARVEDEILMGPDALTWDERDEVERHVEQGVDLMSPLLQDAEAEAIIRHHHERVDGKGYPEGLREDEIPLGARVLAVIDAWFSLTEGRPYRAGVSGGQALAEIRRHAGTQFDIHVMNEFEILLTEMGLLAGAAAPPDPAAAGNRGV